MLRKVCGIVMLVCGALMLPAVAHATTYYVDCSGNDANAGTSAGAAWKTLDKVHAQSFVPGDTVRFKGGCTWDGETNGAEDGFVIDTAGTASNPITFTSYENGVKPIFINSRENYPETDYTASDEIGHTIKVRAPYIVIDNVSVLRSAGSPAADYAGINLSSTSHHVTVKNSEIAHTGIGIRIKSPFNTITHNYFHDLHLVRSDADGGYNDFGAIGVAVENADNDVGFNLCVRCKSPYTPDYAQYTYDPTDGGVVELFGNTSRSNIHHNIAIESEGFVEIGGAHQETISDVTLAYNVSINSPNRFTYVNTQAASGFPVTIQNLRIENNTIINTRPVPADILTKLSYPYLYPRIIDSDGNTPTANQTHIRNNIIAVNEAVYQIADPGIVSDHNVFYFTSTTNALDQNYQYRLQSPTTILGFTPDATDSYFYPGSAGGLPPLFVNGAFPYPISTTLSESSTRSLVAQLKLVSDPQNPALDTAANLGYTSDVEGNSVPQGTAPDRGAFEYQSGSPSPTSSDSCKPADINRDGVVDLTDYSLLVIDFFKSPPANPRSDINSDGIVDLTDYSLLVKYFLQTGSCL